MVGFVVLRNWSDQPLPKSFSKGVLVSVAGSFCEGFKEFQQLLVVLWRDLYDSVERVVRNAEAQANPRMYASSEGPFLYRKRDPQTKPPNNQNIVGPDRLIFRTRERCHRAVDVKLQPCRC